MQKLFSPLAKCIKKGDLAGFDKALIAGEDEFVRRRIYLTLERGRDIALRNLLRKVYVAGGFEEPKDGNAPTRRTRIPVTEFAAAISLGSRERIDNDEVECLLANVIYKVSPYSLYVAKPRHRRMIRFTFIINQLTLAAEPNERIYRTRSWNRCFEQKRRISGHGRMKLHQEPGKIGVSRSWSR